jgi:2TM domain
MPKKMTDDEIREIATKRVRARRGFFWHVIVYVVINLFLIGIWYFTGKGYFWPGWVLGGWGIALILNAIAAFGKEDIWAEREAVEKEVERIKKRNA